MSKTMKKTPAKGSTKAIEVSGLGLGSMGDLSSLLDDPRASGKGSGPLLLDINLIDEDPNQPRTENNPGFFKGSLEELAASIALRGVKTPISVRDNTATPGRYIINHGARRFRSSKLAKKTEIPGFIDNDYNEADQVVENLQRNELTPREIADFIGRELAKGVKKGQIAKAISKSPSFVTQHAALLDLPDPIAAVFNSGRVRDVTVVNELLTAYKQDRQELTDWLADESQDIGRASVKLLREFLDDKARRLEQSDQEEEGGEGDEGEAEDEAPVAKVKAVKKPSVPDTMTKAIVLVMRDNLGARLLLNRRPSAEGFGWLRYEISGEEEEVDLGGLQVVALMEG